MYPLIQVLVGLHLALTRAIGEVASGHPFYQEQGEALRKRGNAVHNQAISVMG